MNKESDHIQKITALEQVNCAAPRLFSIPRPYEDAIVERDKNNFVKVQQLNEHYLDLKSLVADLAKKHEEQFNKTRECIEVGKALLQRYTLRKQRNNDLYS